jgi:hypothetical protein
MRLHIPALLFLLILAGPFVRAQQKDQCVSGNSTIKKEIHGFSVLVSPYHDPSLPPAYQECRALVRDLQKRVVLSVHEPALAVIMAGQDVNGDGMPDVVLEGYSGGMHGTRTYYLISLGTKPGLILKFQTDAVPAHFVQTRNSGAMEIHTWDGEFFMFDGMAAAFSPYPDVYLQIHGARLTDASARHRPDYEKAIRKERANLRPEALVRFRAIDESWQKAGEEELASAVVRITLLYLYSGREAQARQTIQRMWPAWDQERIWETILKTRNQGILRKLGIGIGNK